MRIKALSVISFLLFATVSYGGDIPDYCAAQKQKQSGPAEKTTSAAPEEDDYDVLSLKFDISLTNTGTAVSGNVITRAKVLSGSMGVYAFELNNLITIDSAKVNNQLLPVTTTGAIRKITLPGSLTTGTVFTAQIYYHGQPAPGNGQFFNGGLNPMVVNGNYHIMYSISDKDFASDWWPCKQTLQDKIDTVDMWVTVDDSLKVGSNGLLKNVTSIPVNKKRYEWKTMYPIDYYLICVSVAPYSEYSYYMHFTDGSNDSLLIQNFYYNTAPLAVNEKAALDSTGSMIDNFSKLFGRYPFDKEKYGHCMSPLNGGMEHQTMTTMGTAAFNDIVLISHELGHQWWGDNVTYGSWRDIWLSEGMASYCEQLYLERSGGISTAQAYRKNVFTAALAPTGSVYVDDTTDVNRIFSSALTYKKGASVAHMLRYIAPDDSLFFKALRIYQAQYAKSYAYTTDFKRIVEQTYGIALDSFFNQWVYGQGYPFYHTKWYQQGSTVVIQVTQTVSAPSVTPCFWMPVQFKLKSAAGDKVITLFNNASSQTFVVNWDTLMTGLEIDPEFNILKKAQPPVQDASILKINDLDPQNITVFPNPASEAWHISGLPANASCSLIDATGKTLWQQPCSYETSVPAKHLPSGNYLLLLHSPDDKTLSLRLVK